MILRATAFALPLADESVHCIVTSPPYWGLRKYTGLEGDQFGLEPTLELYIEHSMQILNECWRVLRADGTMWWNLGDSYAGSWGAMSHSLDGKARRTGTNERPPLSYPMNGLKPLDRCGVPERFILAAQKRGWYWRDTIVWQKPNPMPESQSSPRWERHRIKIKEGRVKRHGMERGAGHVDESNVAERPDGAKWQDCPGCLKCLPNGGLVLRWGAWRPTDSYEVIYFLTKTDKYWSDAEAVRERGNDIKTMREIERQKKLRSKGTERGISNDGNVNQSYKWGGDINAFVANGRNLRNVWEFATEPYPEAHFATFPEELPRRCILAGCPEQVCAKCGMGWVRIIGKGEKKVTEAMRVAGCDMDGNYFGRDMADYEAGLAQSPSDAKRRILESMAYETKTLGWKPACDCKIQEISKGIVLDPFAGSGTVVDVALRSARIGIGVELSPDYIKLARKRTEFARKQEVLI